MYPQLSSNLSSRKPRLLREYPLSDRDRIYPLSDRETIKTLIFLIDDQTVAILQYINDYNEQQKEKNPEDRKGLTKDMVAREMYALGVCSRLTTLRILNDLLDKKIIKNTKEKERAFAKLEINKNIDWSELRKELLVSQVTKALAPFKKIVNEGQLSIRVNWNKKGLPDIKIEESPEKSD